MTASVICDLGFLTVCASSRMATCHGISSIALRFFLNESYVVIITCARTPRNGLLFKVEEATTEGTIDDAPKGKRVQAGLFTFKQGY